MDTRVLVRVEIFREGDLYVGISPELNVSSFGETVEEAKRSLREALEAFMEECGSMGTLAEVLEESGFIREEGRWLPRQPITTELLPVG